MAKKKIKVLLADDHAMVRAGIRQFLEHTSEITVLAELSNGQEVVGYLDRCDDPPEVVILDIKMPHMNGIETTAVINNRFPDLRVLILTAFDDDPYIGAILDAGAHGYMLKTATPHELVSAVISISKGESAISPQVMPQLMRITSKRLAESTENVLTKREMEVLGLLKNGLTNKEIAAELGIGDRTVQTHLSNIYLKFDVNNRTEALIRATDLGLVSWG